MKPIMELGRSLNSMGLCHNSAAGPSWRPAFNIPHASKLMVCANYFNLIYTQK
jgi:hypothetical protein